MLPKKSDRPHHDIFYFAKTTNQPPSQPPYSAVGKAPGFKSQGRGLDPGSDHLFFSDFFFSFPKKKYVRAFSQPESTNQPVVIFGIMRSEKRKNQHSCSTASRALRPSRAAVRERVESHPLVSPHHSGHWSDAQISGLDSLACRLLAPASSTVCRSVSHKRSVSLSVALSRTLFVGLSLRNATCSRVRKGLFNFSHAALMDPLTLLDYATPTLRFLRPLSLTRQYHPVALSRWVRKRCLLSI